MRPAPDFPLPPRKYPLDHPSPSLLPHTSATPTTFYLSRNMDASESEDSFPRDGQNDVEDSMYGVHSISDTLPQSELYATSSHAFLDDTVSGDNDNFQPGSPPRSSDDPESTQPSLKRRSTLKPSELDVRYSPIPSPIPPAISDTASRPLTPLNPDDAPSLPSSPKSISNYSLRQIDDISIADDINNQAIGPADEDEGHYPSPRLGPNGASQLIMPSIKMPSRRPFTDRGKAMGRFKLLIAGASGKNLTSPAFSFNIQHSAFIFHSSLKVPPLTQL